MSDRTLAARWQRVRLWCGVAIATGTSFAPATPALAQPFVPLVQLPTDPQPPAELPLPPAEDLPPAEELLPPARDLLPERPAFPDVPDTITVRAFVVDGSTVFSAAELRDLTRPYENRPISTVELFQARSAISQHYIRQGYINSGAYIPPQTLRDGVVRIQVLEGGLADIEVMGTGRLDPAYVRQRLAIAGRTPLNRDRLLSALQLLQQNLLIDSLAAELSASPQPGLSRLSVRIVPADTVDVTLQTDNRRVSSTGSFERGIRVEQGNLLGGGDRLGLDYFNSDGSDEVNASYEIPLGPRDTTLRLRYRSFASRIIQPPLDASNITSQAQTYDLTVRHPLVKTPTEEIATGLTVSRQSSRTLLDGTNTVDVTDIDENGRPRLVQRDRIFATADDRGRTRVSAVRWFQEWVKRGDRQAFAARSQFSLGVDWFDATDNSDRGLPDGQFFTWRTQAEWVRRWSDDLTLFARADVQLADRALLGLEQFAVGGVRSVRGYPQNALIGDNGVAVSAELRWPVYRDRRSDSTLSLIPFIDIGAVWNEDGSRPGNSAVNTAIGTGLGVQWETSDRLLLRLDWGVPLTSIARDRRTWQDNGLYFSMSYAAF